MEMYNDKLAPATEPSYIFLSVKRSKFRRHEWSTGEAVSDRGVSVFRFPPPPNSHNKKGWPCMILRMIVR